MNRAAFISGLGLAGAAVAGTIIWSISDEKGVAAKEEVIGDVALGKAIYDDYCAACHGANLEGQPDWKSPGPDGRLPAPPHDETGHTWHHPDSMLFAYIKLGGSAVMAEQGITFDSGMPGFGDQLSDEEMQAVIAYLKSRWPAPVQKMQAARTAADDKTGG